MSSDPKLRELLVRGSIKPQSDLRAEVKRADTPSPTAIGGALLGGTAAGAFFGPLGAIAGFVVGGIAGEALERQSYIRRQAAGQRQESKPAGA